MTNYANTFNRNQHIYRILTKSIYLLDACIPDQRDYQGSSANRPRVPGRYVILVACGLKSDVTSPWEQIRHLGQQDEEGSEPEQHGEQQQSSDDARGLRPAAGAVHDQRAGEGGGHRGAGEPRRHHVTHSLRQNTRPRVKKGLRDEK